MLAGARPRGALCSLLFTSPRRSALQRLWARLSILTCGVLLLLLLRKKGLKCACVCVCAAVVAFRLFRFFGSCCGDRCYWRWVCVCVCVRVGVWVCAPYERETDLLLSRSSPHSPPSHALRSGMQEEQDTKENSGGRGAVVPAADAHIPLSLRRVPTTWRVCHAVCFFRAISPSPLPLPPLQRVIAFGSRRVLLQARPGASEIEVRQPQCMRDAGCGGATTLPPHATESPTSDRKSVV